MWSFSISVQSRCCIVLMSPLSIKQTNPTAASGKIKTEVSGVAYFSCVFCTILFSWNRYFKFFFKMRKNWFYFLFSVKPKAIFFSQNQKQLFFRMKIKLNFGTSLIFLIYVTSYLLRICQNRVEDLQFSSRFH